MVADADARNRSLGRSRVGCLLGLVLVVTGLYIAAISLRNEIRYRSASEAIRDEARKVRADDRSEARERLLPIIRKVGLPPHAEGFELRPVPNSDRRFRLTIEYADTLQVFNWQRVIPRTIEAETS